MHFVFKIVVYFFLATTITFLALICLGLVDFPSSEQPELNKNAAGCYSNDNNKVFIQLNKNGTMVFSDFSTIFHVEVIKGTYLILPDTNVAYSMTKNKIIKLEKIPRFIKYKNSKMNEFEMDVLNSNSVVNFSKTNNKLCLLDSNFSNYMDPVYLQNKFQL